MPKISVIVPTVRPQNIPALKEKVLAEGLDVEFLWELDSDRIGCPRMVKRLVEKSTGDLICFLGDDTSPEQGFLKAALETMESTGKALIGFRDGVTRDMGHWLADRKLADSLEDGEFFYTGYAHNFCNDELRHRAQRIERFHWSEGPLVRHNHPALGTAPMDDDYVKVLDKDRFEADRKLFMERNCKVSAVIIARNEERMLAECLESVKDADEIIVVDTGSVDGTKEVAKRYTDKVYDYVWDDHFANARNYAKSFATMDWCLSIDADEVLMEGGIALLKTGLSTDCNVVKVNMFSTGDNFNVPRVFRNRPSVEWRDRWHETLNETEGPQSPIRIEFRHGESHAKDPDRNWRLALKCLEDDPNNTRYIFYAAREHGYRGLADEAKDLFLKYLDKSVWMPERAEAYYLLAGIYWKTGEPDKARRACMDALTINANFKAACLFMATMSWEHNAVQWRRMAETATNEGVLFTHMGTA